MERFYGIMDQAPEAAAIRAMHPDDLAESIQKLTWFLVGWSGGPPLYIQAYGHPRLRARHLPFPIDTSARDQWLWCMEGAMDAEQVAPLVRSTLMGAFGRIADHMRNVEDTP